MLDKNKKLLDKLGDGYKVLEQYSKVDTGYEFKLANSRRGENTLVVDIAGEENYFHSKYDPIREAESIVDSYGDIENNSAVIFIGTGLGYHMTLILEKHPDIKFYIYEPIPKLMLEFLKSFDLEKHFKNLLGFNIGDYYYGLEIEKVLDRNKNIKIVTLPIHEKYFKEEDIKFMKYIKNYLKNSIDSIGVDLKFQERWIINSMKNIKYNLYSGNFLNKNMNKFKGETAIIVAAGPSLNYELDNLRYIKENRLAYIFAAGSAINTLVNNEIYPDFLVSYDPGEYNKNALKLVSEKNINSIPLIYGSSIAYEVLEDYTGEVYHVITSQDSLSNYFLMKEDKSSIEVLLDAPTVATITLNLLKELSFSRIVFVGQNLAYLGKDRHARGRKSNKLTDEELKSAIEVESVSGDMVYTNESYNIMRKNMENYIKIYKKEVEFINTTKNGAKIEGTIFKNLEDVIGKLKLEDGIDINKFSLDKEIYSKEHLDKMNRKLYREYKNLDKINKSYESTLGKIARDIEIRDYSSLEKLYIKLDKALRKMENNDFYRIIVLPTIKVQYEMLVNDIDRLNSMKNLEDKSKEIYRKFNDFLNICIKQIELLRPIYKEMKGNIEKYLKEEDAYVK